MELPQRAPLKAVTYYRTGLTLFSPGASAKRSHTRSSEEYCFIDRTSRRPNPTNLGDGTFIANRRFGP
jgi:hypothetical protein